MAQYLPFLLAFAFLVLPWEASSHRSGCTTGIAAHQIEAPTVVVIRVTARSVLIINTALTVIPVQGWCQACRLTYYITPYVATGSYSNQQIMFLSHKLSYQDWLNVKARPQYPLTVKTAVHKVGVRAWVFEAKGVGPYGERQQ